jgi:D-alanine--D-alanine ligase
MPKLKVGVLMGGKSIEKEVSFNSGRTICDHLDTARYEIIPIYQTSDGTLYLLPWHFLHRGKTTDFEHRLPSEATRIIWDTLSDHVEFVYIAMHGRFAEDGILQGALELLGIPYLGSSRLASALCMDKTKVKTVLESNGITTPRGITLPVQESLAAQKNEHAIIAHLKEKNIPMPWVIKPQNEGSSIGVSIVHDEKKLTQAIYDACAIQPNYPQAVIIEERITGMEFSCVTLVDYKTGSLLPLIPTEIVPDPGTDLYDYTQKYMPGRALKFTPPRCSQKIIERIQHTCMQIMKLLNIETISRIDGFVTSDEKIVIVDPNTFSGMAPSSFVFREAAEMNMSHTELINHLIETDIQRYQLKTQLTEQEKKQNAMKKKLRVGVLLGGSSHEREISLESGRNITYKLSPESYEITPIFVTEKNTLASLTQSQLVRNSTSEIAAALTPDQTISWHSLPEQFDFIFNGLHGGAGENGSVQGMLELLGMPYNGSSVFASALCMDKYKTSEFLHALDFDTPQHYLVDKKSWNTDSEKELEQIKAKINAPYIVKPADDGCSVMVYSARTTDELRTHIESVLESEKQSVLIEEHVKGMELTVGVLGNESPQALPPSYAVANAGVLSIEEKFLPGAGENQTPAPLPAEALQLVQRTMEQVYLAIGCQGYARIDCFYQTAQQSPTGKERVVILEINTLPGLTPATCIFHQAAEIGLKPMEFIDRIITLGIAAHAHTKTDSISTPTRKIAHKEQSL